MKSLVVYFSRAGENSVDGRIEVIERGYTEILARKIASKTSSHIFQIEPVVPYPFSYEECLKRAKEELNPDYLHPEFKIDDYDVIFLGFPSWYRTYPRIVAHFIADNVWFGKTVIPFCTNEEGEFGIAELQLRGAVKGAILKQGFAERGYNVENCDAKVEAWLKAVL